MEYAVYANGEEIGKAQITRRGLYYEIRCECRLKDMAMHRLVVSGGEKQLNLGVLVPEGDFFGLHTQIPIRSLGDGPFRFELDGPKREGREFVSIIPEEPFPCIDQLKNAVLENRDGIIGASIVKL